MKRSDYTKIISSIFSVMILGACNNNNNAYNDDPTPNIQRVNNGIITKDEKPYSHLSGQPKTTVNPQTNNRQIHIQQTANNANTASWITDGISAVEARVIEWTNAERRKRGLPNLIPDSRLSNVARVKSGDMQSRSYFSHQSPTYGDPFKMMKTFGVKYTAAGENIAAGQQTAKQVVDAWMKSEGHRANILNENFTHIGVGHNQNGNYWTQMFVGR